MVVAAVADDLRAKIEALARVLYLVDYPDVPEAAEWWDLPRENPEGFDHGSWVVQAATALAWFAAHPVQVTTAEELDALPVAWVIEYDEHPTHPGSHVGPFQTPTAADAWAATFARPGWRASYIVAPLYRPDRPEVTP